LVLLVYANRNDKLQCSNGRREKDREVVSYGAVVKDWRVSNVVGEGSVELRRTRTIIWGGETLADG